MISFTGFFSALPNQRIGYVGALVDTETGVSCELWTNEPEMFAQALKERFPNPLRDDPPNGVAHE